MLNDLSMKYVSSGKKAIGQNLLLDMNNNLYRNKLICQNVKDWSKDKILLINGELFYKNQIMDFNVQYI